MELKAIEKVAAIENLRRPSTVARERERELLTVQASFSFSFSYKSCLSSCYELDFICISLLKNSILYVC